MADIGNLVEELSKLTVIEAADLVKQLETKWGVSAAAPVAAAAAPAGGAAAPAAEAKTTFDVILVSAPVMLSEDISGSAQPQQKVLKKTIGTYRSKHAISWVLGNVLLTPFIVYRTKPQLVYKKIPKQKIDVVKKLSKEFKTLLVPLDRIFEDAARKKESTYWSEDGIHPTAMGHSLIARSWIKTVNGSFT